MMFIRRSRNRRVDGEAVFEAKKLGKTRCLDMTVKTTELVMQVLENHGNKSHTAGAKTFTSFSKRSANSILANSVS